MAVLQKEPKADACVEILDAEDRLLISAATVTEALIVAARRRIGAEMKSLIDGLGFEIVSVSSALAYEAARAHDRWGRGVHSAALNFGDCFAYALAKAEGCRLLYVGDDFSQTDVSPAL